MGFYETNIQGEIQKNKSESVDFAKAWKESREEYRGSINMQFYVK